MYCISRRNLRVNSDIITPSLSQPHNQNAHQPFVQNTETPLLETILAGISQASLYVNTLLVHRCLSVEGGAHRLFGRRFYGEKKINLLHLIPSDMGASQELCRAKTKTKNKAKRKRRRATRNVIPSSEESDHVFWDDDLARANYCQQQASKIKSKRKRGKQPNDRSSRLLEDLSNFFAPNDKDDPDVPKAPSSQESDKMSFWVKRTPSMRSPKCSQRRRMAKKRLDEEQQKLLEKQRIELEQIKDLVELIPTLSKFSKSFKSTTE